MQTIQSSIAPNQNLPQNSEIWESLKKAIAQSSGFKRWQQEQVNIKEKLGRDNLDIQVSLYLQATLKTLAY